MTHPRSISTRQILDLHIEPSPYNSSAISLISSDDSSSPASSLSGSRSSSSDSAQAPASTSPVIVICSVLCLHDFVAEEENALPFRRNEILEVVKKEGTGWWAAMRRGGSVVGWIPEAFVKPLTAQMARRLREIREELRVYEFQAEQLYSAASSASLGLIDSTGPSNPPAYWQNNPPSQRQSSSQSIARTGSREALNGRSQGEVNANLLHVPQRAYSRSRMKSLPPPPPSPTTPMPHPPAQSAPLFYNKPVPPLPHEQLELRTRASSLSSRSLRRRPLIVNDNSALTRLSTLIENRDTREIDELAHPDISGSFHALAKRSRSQMLRQTSGSKGHEPRPQTIFKVLEKPWYILPAHADELELDQAGNVRSGTLLALVERLTSDIAFSNPTRTSTSSRPECGVNPALGRDPFPSIFLMTFRTFTTSEELFDLLLDRFSMTRPDNLNQVEVEDWKRRCLVPTQRHVLDVFNLWLEGHRLLEEDPHIAQRLPDFIRQVATPRLPVEGQALLQNIERLTFADPVRPSRGLPPKKPLKTKEHKNDVLRVDAAYLADQLTLYEYHLYSKITPRECLAYVNTQSGPEVHDLVNFCSTYDKLGGWVKMTILNQESSIPKRANTIDHWIKVAERCRANCNFSSMSSIISALSSVVITRLHLTWAHVGRKSQLDTLLKHNEPTGGFAGYRNLLSNVDSTVPCVPFITMYLTDLIRTREQFRDEPDRISFIQRQRWHETISLLLKFQHRQPQHIYNEYITAFISTQLRGAIISADNSWFWAKSQEVQHSELANADFRDGLEQAGF